MLLSEVMWADIAGIFADDEDLLPPPEDPVIETAHDGTITSHEA